jgi:hypothetical protein
LREESDALGAISIARAWQKVGGRERQNSYFDGLNVSFVVVAELPTVDASPVRAKPSYAFSLWPPTKPSLLFSQTRIPCAVHCPPCSPSRADDAFLPPLQTRHSAAFLALDFTLKQFLVSDGSSDASGCLYIVCQNARHRRNPCNMTKDLRLNPNADINALTLFLYRNQRLY